MSNTSLMSELSDNIRRLRIARGMSPEELSNAVGMSRTYFRKLEGHDFSAPSYKVVRKLAEFFNVPVSEIYGPTEEPLGKGPDNIVDQDLTLFTKLHVRWRAQAGTWVEVDQVPSGLARSRVG